MSTYADYLFTNAAVFTADPANPRAEAVAVRGNRIVFVGRSSAAADWQGPHTQVIDARGRSLLPGLIDSHFHLLWGSLKLDKLRLDEAESLDAIAAAIAAYAAANPQREWIEGVQLKYGAIPAGERLDRWFLDADVARDKFIGPAIEGLGQRAGPLVFQFSPAPHGMLADPVAWIERLGLFLEMLPRNVRGLTPLYAVELRNPEFLTPRLMRMLREQSVRYVIGLHDRMPGVERQANALRVLDDCMEGDYAPIGPLIVRWNLRPGLKYEEAKEQYFPFDRLVDEDPDTRRQLAALVRAATRNGQPAFIIANNKAEGSAPLSLLKLAEAIEAGAS